jgi:hypothetical protein
MTTRNLVNGRTWTPDDIGRALSAQALSTVMMARFHIVERVKRSLIRRLTCRGRRKQHRGRNPTRKLPSESQKGTVFERLRP